MVFRVIYSKLVDFQVRCKGKSSERANEELENKFNRFKPEPVPETLPCVPGHRRKSSVFKNYICC